MKKEKPLLEKDVPRKMIKLLLKEELSSSDLADKIYGNRNVRSSISFYLNEFEKKGWITKRDTLTKRKLYKLKLNILANFNEGEERFVKLFIERFWKPTELDPIKSINDSLLESLFIKRIYGIKGKVLDYSPKKDLEKLKNNRNRFLKDKIFRDKFLDELFEEGEKIINKKSPLKLHITRDLIFFSLLIPDTIFDKLSVEYRYIESPIYVAVSLLD